jgi:glycosyltransferase involved in cell wall biosynthesis
VRRTGFVTAEVRDALMAGATAMVVPSRLESLSLSMLESFELGVPVVANGASPVLDGHVRACGAGVSYRSRRELAAALAAAVHWTDEERRHMGEAGRRYVAKNYAWPLVGGRWLGAVEALCAELAERVGKDRPSGVTASPGPKIS